MEETISSRVKHKSKSIFARIFFSRTMITFLLLILQIAAIFALLFLLDPYSSYLYTGATIISAFVIIYLSNCKVRPEFKLVWMLPLCATPLFGVLLYLFVTINPGTIGLKKSLQFRIKETKGLLPSGSDVTEKIKKEDIKFSQLTYYLETVGNYPTYEDNKVTYYPLGENQWNDIISALKEAKEFIFLEYFIIEEGIMWDSVLEILKEKAASGVDVRVMYDGTCTILHVPYNYNNKLNKMGIKTEIYSPIMPFLSTRQNNRDHRKILVIDGKTAFTGGINLSDEYINQKRVFGHWKDVGIKIEGNAVNSFTIMFLQMWYLDSRQEGVYRNYLRVSEQTRFETDNAYTGYVTPYGDDATNSEDIAENVYMDIVNNAKSYVHIMTPYLVIDNDMLEALCFTAKKGVEVSLILPHIPDKKTPYYVARTYYPLFLNAGVKIYEYEPGFIHAKMFVSDDNCGTVGSINLDYRSLYHHFECGAVIYNNPVIKDMEQDFQDTLKKCIQVTREYYKKIPKRQKLVGQICKVYSPLI